jgi:hypothetical protein
LPDFPKRYSDCELLIINAALMFPRAKLDHLSLPEVGSLLGLAAPETAVITHMGNDLLDRGGKYISRRLATKKTKVTAATDGMTITLERPVTILKTGRAEDDG